MNCDQAQRLVSARLDGVYLPPTQTEAVEAHVPGCPGCTRFIEASRRARIAVRIRPAEQIPDLVGQIMVGIEDERRKGRRRASRGRNRPSRRATRPRVALVAAALSGALVGSLVVGGPWQRPDGGPIAAAAVVQGVRGAAPSLEAFGATYEIVERGLAPDVPVRSLVMDVAFLAPQRFRLDVRDRTEYPSPAWTPTDITYIEDMPASFLSGPTGCPAELGPGVCPTTRTTVSRASAYSAAAPLPADLILPLSTLGSARGIRVAGEEVLDGQPAVRVEMSFSRAAPLFPFLRLGGTWRPFFSGDRVDLWLDATTWFPLRIAVTPSDEPERRSWEIRFGRAPESTGSPILDIRAVGFDAGPPEASRFDIPGIPATHGVSLETVVERAGFRPVTPAVPGGLALTRVVLPPDGFATPRSLLLYTDGLDYVRIGEHPSWSGAGPFGPVDALAQQVEVPGVGVAFYEPAGEGLGRRLAIHAAGTDLFIESNVPRERLLDLAGSLPVRGLIMPRPWRVTTSGDVSIERVGVSDALALARLDGLSEVLPDDYLVASARIERRGGRLAAVTLQLRQPDVDAAGPPLTLHVEPVGALPPASSSDQVRIRFGGSEGRYTPGGPQLEWVRDGAYLSLQGALDLSGFVTLASAIGEVVES